MNSRRMLSNHTPHNAEVIPNKSSTDEPQTNPAPPSQSSQTKKYYSFTNPLLTAIAGGLAVLAIDKIYKKIYPSDEQIHDQEKDFAKTSRYLIEIDHEIQDLINASSFCRPQCKVEFDSTHNNLESISNVENKIAEIKNDLLLSKESLT